MPLVWTLELPQFRPHRHAPAIPWTKHPRRMSESVGELHSLIARSTACPAPCLRPGCRNGVTPTRPIGANDGWEFELYRGSSGDFRFRLKAGNGEIIATSEGYTTKAAAQNGITSVKNNADSPTVDLT